MKYAKIADNENFDLESLDNIWTVDMFMDNLDSPDGHDTVEFTKIGLIDFLNGEIEEYDSPNYSRLSQNASNEELREAVYDYLEGKVISIEPYRRIYGSMGGFGNVRRHLHNSRKYVRNSKGKHGSYTELDYEYDLALPPKRYPRKKLMLNDDREYIVWYEPDTRRITKICNDRYEEIEVSELIKNQLYLYLNIELDEEEGVEDPLTASRRSIRRTAGWKVEKVNDSDWIIHTPKGYYVDENDKEYHFSTKEKALAEIDYLRAEHKYEKKSELGFNANPENEEEERVLEIATELDNACFNAYKANGWNGWGTLEERQRGIDIAKKALAPLVEKYYKELSDDRFFKMLYRHNEDNNYHTENKALEELTGRKRRASMNKKAYYDEYEDGIF